MVSVENLSRICRYLGYFLKYNFLILFVGIFMRNINSDLEIS